MTPAAQITVLVWIYSPSPRVTCLASAADGLAEADVDTAAPQVGGSRAREAAC